MRAIVLSSLTLISLASTAAAEVTLSYGATFTSRYVASGIEQSSGSAIQPWVEVGYGGAYVGLWASNVSRAGLGASAEVDLTFGYRGEAGAISYDVGYARYFYTGPYSNCCGEIVMDLSSSPTEQSTFGLRMTYDPSADVMNAKISVDYAPTDTLGLNLAFGSISNGGHEYWTAGTSYSINDNLSVSASWNDTNITKGVAVLSVDLAY